MLTLLIILDDSQAKKDLFKRLFGQCFDTALTTPITNIFNPAQVSATASRPRLETVCEEEENNQENELQGGSNDLAPVVNDSIGSASIKNDQQEQAPCTKELDAPALVKSCCS